MHSLLARQLKKLPAEASAALPREFLAAIEAAYQSYDNDCRMIEHTLEVMSSELQQRNEQLASRLREKQDMMDTLQKTYDELLVVHGKLDKAQSQLVQADKMASIGQLAAGVAHEINNPIGFVQSNMASLGRYVRSLFQLVEAQIAEEAQLPAHRRAAMQALRAELDYEYLVEDTVALMAESSDGMGRVTRIVQALKDFSRVDNTGWEVTDVVQGIQSTLHIVSSQLQHNAAIVCELAPLPPVECVLPQLNQVFMNLLINASHAIRERGTITIRCWLAGDEVAISFQDSGCGIPEQVLPRIFDAFYTTKPVGQGTGLGLSLSYSIIKKHHGRIEVDSVVDVGTTFTLRLPLRQPRTA